MRVTRWKKHWLYGDKMISSPRPGKVEEEQGGNLTDTFVFEYSFSQFLILFELGVEHDNCTCLEILK